MSTIFIVSESKRSTRCGYISKSIRSLCRELENVWTSAPALGELLNRCLLILKPWLASISPNPWSRARAHAVASNRLNIEYVLGSDTSLESLGWGSFDFIYTNITLQHLNNDMQKDYIRQFGLLLKSGALAVVQIPSKRPSVSFIDSIVGALKQVGLKNLAALAITSFKEGIAPWKIKMELNILSEAEVEEAARKSDLTIIRRAYIDWETFYETLKFSLLEAPRPGRSRYPTSPLYFMRKV